MTATGAAPVPVGRNTGRDLKRAALHAFLIAMAVLWLLPLAFAVYTSLRPREETDAAGYLSLPTTINLDNYIDAWNQAELVRYFLNSLIIVVPAVLLVLFLASMMAFAVSRYSWRFNLIFLLIFTAANLLPPQVIITPLYRIFLRLWLPTDVGVAGFPSDNGLFYQQYIGIIAIHVAFQLGFCTFVLSNYMKTIPRELNEAAVVDGASIWKSYRSVIMPLTRPALAALATLQVTWVYNDFFWALVLMSGKGAKMPITSALNNLKGQFFTDYNLLAAGAVLVAIPTLIVFFALQKQFISGLTLGSTKG
ncbi:MAG TPA: carbohydrate ABC transporter permease [Candidatus Deferrimicrobium sp.]|nr:carbohydrate ABC transporter permease [Candidatus Deferrimicrobium sp.]